MCLASKRRSMGERLRYASNLQLLTMDTPATSRAGPNKAFCSSTLRSLFELMR